MTTTCTTDHGKFAGSQFVRCPECGEPVNVPMQIKIIPTNEHAHGNTVPPGKLADAELHFDDGPLAGLKLIGFAIWEHRAAPTPGAPKKRNVTFPARQYSVNGERRSFALLRVITDATAQDRLRDQILDAFAQFEVQQEWNNPDTRASRGLTEGK